MTKDVKRPARPKRPGQQKTLAFLANLAIEFTAVLSLPDLVDRVLESLRGEVGFDSCAVALRDGHGGDALSVLGASGVRADFRGTVIPRGKGIHWAVMEAGTPLNVPDMHADPRLFRRMENVRSALYVPLVVHGHPIGVLSAYRVQTNAFSQDELDLLTVVARYLAGAFEVARLHEQLRDLAVTDTLTGLHNRRFFLERLDTELGRSRRSGRPFSVALADLDGFKAINDTYGHAAGDAALMRVAEVFRRSIREYDLAARFGGDEFILLLPETAAAQADMVLRRLDGTGISVTPDGTGPAVTVSWGAATWPGDGESGDVLINIADARLYAMKRTKHPLAGTGGETSTRQD